MSLDLPPILQYFLSKPASIDVADATEKDVTDIERPPCGPEIAMQTAWAIVLGADAKSLARDSHFFKLGGDACKVFSLCRLCGANGVQLTPRDVYTHPVLKDVSALRQNNSYRANGQTGLTKLAAKNEMRSYASRVCQVDEGSIVDILPCTPLQEGLLALTGKDPGAYVARMKFRIDKSIHLDRLRDACNQVVVMNPILRTRMVSIPGHGIVQAVLAEEAHWESEAAQAKPPMGLGTRLTSFHMLPRGADGEGVLLWEMHHAIYDGWSMDLMLREVEQVYGQSGELQHLHAMDDFLDYVSGVDERTKSEFWQSQFSEIQGAHFPAWEAGTPSPAPDCRLEITVDRLKWSGVEYTPTILLRAAWAVVAASCTGANEAILGVTVNGRQAPVGGIEVMVGPAIATFPVRIGVDADQHVDAFLQGIQRQSADLIPFEQTGLQYIRRVSEEAGLACDFQTLLIVQSTGGAGGGRRGDQDAGSPLLPEIDDETSTNAWRDFSTNALIIECNVESRSAHIFLDFDSSLISRDEVRHVAGNLAAVLRLLSDESHYSHRVGSIAAETQTPFGLHRIWGWNQRVPPARHACIHHLVAQRVQQQPSAPAVCAWDGDLTYSQLHDLSGNLASRLVSMGAAGTFVPLFFEKSMWMPVAALSVMKAGGACVAFDMTLPEERLRSLAAQIPFRLAISSVENTGLAKKLIAEDVDMLVVGPRSRSVAPPEQVVELPSVQPSQTLYVVFTSGSTGTPKAAMISHQNFCSAIAHQQEHLLYSEKSRILDFSSYAFDVTWANLLHSFTTGGCICVPSAFERENQLAESITKYRANLVDMTTSLARMLGPDVLSKLDVLTLGGEAVQPTDALLAGNATTIINAYGPAECTTSVTCGKVRLPTITIGRGIGVCTWVVNAHNPEMLVPLGEVGELWIEGPLVGQGYFNNPEKTAQSFVESPRWLLRGTTDQEGRRGCLYRTGDLVRYLPSGELVFIGRKDTQVKIRGQRVELGEVEYQVSESMKLYKGDDIRSVTVVVESIRPKSSSGPVLVALVSLECQTGEMEQGELQARVQHLASASSENLSSRIPVYMVPVAYIAVEGIPLTPSGKLDRRKIVSIAESAWNGNRGQPRSVTEQSVVHETLTDTEKVLQQIWMSVLNLPAEEVSASKAFTRIGGDSISAMQIVAQCRQRNLATTVRDVLEAGSIRSLAGRCKPICQKALLLDSAAEDQEERVDEPFDLSPIQQLFFTEFPDGLNHFNQSFVLELGKKVAGESIAAAVQDLAERHSILRARFHPPRGETGWTQSISASGPGSFAFEEHSVSGQDQVTQLSQWRQENFDIRSGPVFACDLFNLPDGSQLVTLSAHHLVVDLVSWRVIWADLQDHIEQGKLVSAPTVSWRSWIQEQIRASRHLSPMDVLPFSVPPANVGFWGLDAADDTMANSSVAALHVFDSLVTSLLYGQANESLRTEPIDILLGAMVHSFAEAFPERDPLVPWIEGHGREQMQSHTDVSGTVGWFTTICPVPVAVTAGDSVLHAIRLAKDTRRAIPGKGLPYFACRFYSQSGREAFRHHDQCEVTFNLTGRFQQLEADDGLFRYSPQMRGDAESVSVIAGSARRPTVIEINGDVEGDMLTVSFQTNRNIRHGDRLRRWVAAFGREVESAVEELARSRPALTLGDVPLLRVPYEGFDRLMREQLPGLGIRPDNVADLLPCSPLQEGILLSLDKEDASYDTSSIWRCVGKDGATTIDGDAPVRMETAWRAVVKRHTILSTVFALHPEGKGYLQVVLREVQSQVATRSSGAEAPETVLGRAESPRFASNEPQHAFTICRSDSGDMACRLDINHALIDAVSMSAILHDLVCIYHGITPAPAPPFSDMMRYICSVPTAQRLAPWASMLAGVKPCEFPISNTLDSDVLDGTRSNTSSDVWALDLPGDGPTSLCRAAGVTRAVFFQVVWAMTLGPARASRGILKAVNAKSIERLSMQHTSLAEVQHMLGISDKKLFNTSISVRESERSAAAVEQSLSLVPVAEADHHEFDLTLHVSFDGDLLDASIEYRQPNISREVVRQVAGVLSAAVDFLLLGNFDSASAQVNGYGEVGEETSNSFHRHLVGSDEATTTAFWKTQFEGTTGSHFPEIQPFQHGTKEIWAEAVFHPSCDIGDLEDAAAVASIRAAWALLASSLVGSTEAVFGAVVESALLPVRISVDRNDTIESFLQAIQQQERDARQFCKTGLEKIRRIDDNCALACDFQTILSVIAGGDDETTPPPVPFAILVTYEVRPAGSRVTVRYNTALVGKSQVTRWYNQFTHILAQFLDRSFHGKKLDDMSLVNSHDLLDICRWNSGAGSVKAGQYAADQLMAQLLNVHTWIVETDNPQRLAPIGAVGELCLEISRVGTKGLDATFHSDAASTQQQAAWLDRVAGRRGHRTGYLARYHHRGSLQVQGRKDTEVTFRGRRFNLETVEKRVRETISALKTEWTPAEVVVELVQTKDGEGKILAAFVSTDRASEGRDETAVQEISSRVRRALARVVPGVMIPAVLIPFGRDVFVAADDGRVDRLALRQHASELTVAEMTASSRAAEKHAPSEVVEKQMQGLWAEALSMKPDEIDLGDNFFRIGGDSILAMKLVGLARKSGLLLTVRDVFKQPVLRELCSCLPLP
ncbi:uncharacterized protein UV8b_04722 [Ustilaginoidea virens]|uniref:Carrier domain-containing protein n=1 Tax=Ustilaginoidea virens TaxID=1159556 RepID=A0A8E5MI90_USTVR|nr:uncharacterized protein UV8b_04722 [Ustilaginoidea virens]QUC20481.1 hypothetical protein UV8b_04722 [Ustilaginoidea virens]